MDIIAKSTNVLFCDLYDLQRDGVMVDTSLILDDGEVSIHWAMLDLYGLGQWWSGLGLFRKHLFPLRVKLDSCHFDWEEGKTEYKFKDSKNKRSKNEYFATIDFSNKRDLFHFLANEPVGFMFKLKNLK